jgi:uncharacterized protein (TIGR03435 family)
MHTFRTVAAFLSLSGAAIAQATQTDTKPQFEVASVKPAKPFGPLGKRSFTNGGPGTGDAGLYSCQNCALIMVVTRAYGLDSDHPSFAPGWMSDQRFDVAAKMPPGTTQEQFSLMLRNLLAERFKLAVHHEKRETQVYNLVVAKNGPKLKEWAPPAVNDATGAPNDGAPAPGQSLPLKKDQDGFPVIPRGSGIPVAVGLGHARLRLDNEPIAKFAEMIGSMLGRPVIDATGLTGKYNFLLSWAPERLGARATDDDSGPTLEGAIQAQLGLKLESKKGMVDVLVIDHAEKVPTEN